MSVVLICSMVFSLQITPVIAEDAGITDGTSFYENLSEAEFAEDDTITVLIEFDDSTTHEHSYTHSYTTPTRLGHTCHCACGEAEIEPHVFQEIFGEARTCAYCGYQETIG